MKKIERAKTEIREGYADLGGLPECHKPKCSTEIRYFFNFKFLPSARNLARTSTIPLFITDSLASLYDIPTGCRNRRFLVRYIGRTSADNSATRFGQFVEGPLPAPIPGHMASILGQPDKYVPPPCFPAIPPYRATCAQHTPPRSALWGSRAFMSDLAGARVERIFAPSVLSCSPIGSRRNRLCAPGPFTAVGNPRSLHRLSRV
jgi:hypothetical protein